MKMCPHQGSAGRGGDTVPLVNNPVVSWSFSYPITIPWFPWRRDQSLLCCPPWIYSLSRSDGNCKTSLGLQSGETQIKSSKWISFQVCAAHLALFLCEAAFKLWNCSWCLLLRRPPYTCDSFSGDGNLSQKASATLQLMRVLCAAEHTTWTCVWCHYGSWFFLNTRGDHWVMAG